MDSATLLRAGRRGTCRAGGESAWPRRARVDAAGACFEGATGVGASGEMASWSGPCVSARPFTWIPIGPFSHPPTCPFTPMDASLHSSICLPLHLLIHVTTHSFIHPPTHLSMHPTVLPFIHPYKLEVVNGCNLSIPEAEIELLPAPVKPFLPNENLCFKKKKERKKDSLGSFYVSLGVTQGFGT